ncbi:MAG TPA: hypothetical protein GX711_07080 [Clostridia bacterium]|nr:hypothetical protein [Clostridia bacterium]
MSKRFLSVILFLALLPFLLIPAPAEASWGAAKLLELRNQEPAAPPTETPPAPVPEDPADITPAPPAGSIADKILELRRQKTNPPVVPPETEQPLPEDPTVPDPVPPGNTDPRILHYDAQLLINLVNTERQANGLKPLAYLEPLGRAAIDKSLDMLENNYFSHISPTYGSFAQMVYNRGIPFRSVGENLAMARNTEHAHRLLMTSELHRKNILNPNFNRVGVGIVQSPYGVIVTELFIMQ